MHASFSDGLLACDNRTPIWGLWDSFGIESAEMIGWWDDDAPVFVTGPGSDDVQVTSYVRHANATLLAVATWSTVNTTVALKVDWAALGLSGATATVDAPAMEGVQPHATFPVSAGSITLPVEAAAGWLLILSGNTDSAA